MIQNSNKEILLARQQLKRKRHCPEMMTRLLTLRFSALTTKVMIAKLIDTLKKAKTKALIPAPIALGAKVIAKV